MDLDFSWKTANRVLNTWHSQYRLFDMKEKDFVTPLQFPILGPWMSWSLMHEKVHSYSSLNFTHMS